MSQAPSKIYSNSPPKGLGQFSCCWFESSTEYSSYKTKPYFPRSFAPRFRGRIWCWHSAWHVPGVNVHLTLHRKEPLPCVVYVTVVKMRLGLLCLSECLGFSSVQIQYAANAQAGRQQIVAWVPVWKPDLFLVLWLLQPCGKWESGWKSLPNKK